MTKLQICEACGKAKPATSFSWNPRTGRRCVWCKACGRQARANRRGIAPAKTAWYRTPVLDMSILDK